jgi:hypothetical protein
VVEALERALSKGGVVTIGGSGSRGGMEKEEDVGSRESGLEWNAGTDGDLGSAGCFGRCDFLEEFEERVVLRFFLLGGLEADSAAGEFSDRNVGGFGGFGDFGAASRDMRASRKFSGRNVEAVRRGSV